MRKTTALAGSAIFFLLAPFVVAGVIPWWITRWNVAPPLPLGVTQQAAGAVSIAAGVSVLVYAFGRFVVEGLGTPAPVAPTERLVVGGPYRYVRNPMYVAVLAIVVGQAIVFNQAALLRYALLLFVGFFLFVKVYEEPTLANRYGAEYEEYRRAVRGWWPRLRPWERFPP